jgi:hypothetical protein
MGAKPLPVSVSAKTRTAVSGASVWLGPFLAETDSDGRFSLPGRPGTFTLRAVKDGYDLKELPIKVDESTPLFGLTIYLTKNPLSYPVISPLTGIQPVIQATLAEAVELGEQGFAADMIGLVSLRERATRRKVAPAQGRKLSDGPFLVAVRTPFTRAIEAAGEAKRKYEPRPILAPDELNKGLVEVVVGSKDMKADVITSMVIKRENNLVRPLRQVSLPVQIANLMGGVTRVANSAFVFDLDTFRPTSDITLVLIGERENFEYLMSSRELKLLR